MDYIKVEIKPENCIYPSTPSQTEHIKQEESQCLNMLLLYNEVKEEPVSDHEQNNECEIKSEGVKIKNCLKVNSLKCDLCEEYFKNKSKLRNHVLVKHFDSQQDYEYKLPVKSEKVDISDKICIKNERAENKPKFRNNDRPNNCSICNKSFKNKSYLTQHEAIHEDERPHSCSVCGKAFKNKSYLIQHQAIHDNERQFICQVCNKSFKQKSSFFRHGAVHDNQNIHSCPVCNKSFKQKRYLNLHKAIHGNERPHICSVCNKSFKYKSNLIVHKAVHGNEKPHTCSVCNKTFKYKKSLTVHETIHNAMNEHIYDYLATDHS